MTQSNSNPPSPPSGADNTGATLESLITTFIMQYDQKIKISNKRNIEAVERHKAAIQKWAAQETNKAYERGREDERVEWHEAAARVDPEVIKARAALTADKEQADVRE